MLVFYLDCHSTVLRRPRYKDTGANDQSLAETFVLCVVGRSLSNRPSVASGLEGLASNHRLSPVCGFDPHK